jgi:hypothetical protein
LLRTLSLLALACAFGPAALGQTPVLVELFTSEGCSSCPPADRLLARLAAEQPVPGAFVVPLALHVDYWDRLGWKDPYSSAAFTERQGAYAARFGNAGQVYTPQMVVDGRTEFVGNDESAARRAIAAAAKEPRAFVRLERGADPGTVRITVAGVPAASPILLALTEDPPASDVTRGENAGKKLAHVAVARDLRVVGVADERGRFDARVPAGDVPSGRRTGRLVAFVQAAPTGPVLGVSRPADLAVFR